MMAFDRKRTRKLAFRILFVFLILFLLIAYLHYLDLKKTLLIKISDQATSVIGQNVHIENLSIGPSATINFYNITISNPKDFDPGQLLQIKRARLDLRPIQLLKGKLSFKKIIVYSPELTLIKNGRDRWNISDTLMRFFSKKSAAKYQVDEFGIDSGIFDFNRDERYRNDHINLRLENLSSDPGTKTGIKGNLLYAGSRIEMDGWTCFNDTPKKVNISISSENFSLPALRKSLEPLKIDPKKTRIGVGLHAEGDAEKGFHITSTLRIKRAGFFLFTKDISDIYLRADATYWPRDLSLVIHAASLYTHGASVATLQGVVSDIKKKPAYRAEIKIGRLDLSEFNFMKDLKMSGILTSNNIRIKGNFEAKVPEVSGDLRLREGGIESHRAIIERINADVIFSSDKEMSVKGEVSARVMKVGEYLLGKPANARLSATLRGTQQQMAVVSFLDLSRHEIKFKGGETVYLEGSHLMIDGIIKDSAFSGKTSFETKGIQYADYIIRGLRSSSSIDYQKNEITIKNLTSETEYIKSSATQVRITLLEKKTGYEVDITDMNVSVHDGEVVLNQCDLYLGLQPGQKSISGDLRFSLGNMMIQGMSFAQVSGQGRFDEKNFSIDISRAEVSGGRINLTAYGKTSEGPFPIKTSAVAERISLGALAKSTSKWLKIPSGMTGDFNKATFEGTINSQDSLNGHAFVEARKVSVLNPETGRNIIKDAFFKAEIEFMGKDLALKAEATAGTLSMRLSGTLEEFMGKERHLQVKGILPEVEVTEIRNSFWDVFPDSLLYIGLRGSISSEISANYSKDGFEVSGNVHVKNCILEGENGEYSIGPINGTLPIGYGKSQEEEQVVKIPSFEKSQFDDLSNYYAQESVEEGFHRMTIGSLTYGFRLLENIQLRIKQKGNILSIERIDANMFGGKLNGSMAIDLSNGIHSRGGFLVKGLSLKTLCENIEPIKGFISGKVDGIATFKGAGYSIPTLMGMADFWTYPTRGEKTIISKEFLQKVGGPSLKAFLRNRHFNKGMMSLYLKDGFVIFKELEISNVNVLGMTDLSIKVVPVSNKIALDQLLWTITEAAERAKKKQ
jgi:hypothetical protein